MDMPSDPADIKKAMSLSNIMEVDTPSTVRPTTEVTDCATSDLGQKAADMPMAKTESPSTTDEDSPSAEPEEPDTDNVDDAAPVQREFRCMNNEYAECRTGQYTLKLSRKVISNHFGRNKGCTRMITDWPLFCRKHYQRATYKPKLWQHRKIKLILRQFDIIERDFPGTRYTTSLKKSELDRLNLFARKTDGGMPPHKAAEYVVPNKEIKSFQAPIDVLRELQEDLGEGKTKAEVESVVCLIEEMLTKGETEEVPSIEFLPEIPRSLPTAIQMPQPATPQKNKSKGTGGRVNAKGAIKKSRAK